MTISNYSASAISNLPTDFSSQDVNQRLQQLQQNIAFLSEVMQTVREGSALIGYNAEIDADSSPDIEVGSPVYYDTTAGKFKLSKLSVTMVGEVYVAEPSSEVWGIVLKKCSDSRAHLLLDGLAAINMQASTGDPTPEGKYYLSRNVGQMQSTPDNMLRQPVFLGTGDGEILFRPFFADNYPRFVPRQVSLTPGVAGTASTSGTNWVFSGPDSNQAGWLPANHAVFGGKAPVGAYAGYNFSQDPDIADVWPPLHPRESRLLVDPGGNRSRGYFTILGADNDRCVVNSDGIWWMTNCVGQMPWDFLADGAENQTVCPKSLPRRLWIESQFAGQLVTDPNTLNSLRSKIPWLKVFAAGTQTPAVRGDLELALSEQDWIRETPLDFSHLALKGLDSGQFTRGPVVTTIRSNSPSLQITGGHDMSDEGDPEKRAGELVLSLNAAADTDVLPLRSQLFGATTESFRETMATGFRAGVDSSAVFEMHIPKAVQSGSELGIVITFLAAETINFPSGFAVRVMRIPETTGNDSEEIPSYQNLSFPNYPQGQQLAANHYRTTLTNKLAVAGGDRLYIKLSRAGVSDGVGGMLQVLGISGRF